MYANLGPGMVADLVPASIGGSEVLYSDEYVMRRWQGSWSLYAYTDGNPATFVDPLGLQAECTDICAQAQKMGLNKGQPGQTIAGQVICGPVDPASGMRALCPCVADTSYLKPAFNLKGLSSCDLIKDCLEMHEQGHINANQCDCKGGPGISKASGTSQKAIDDYHRMQTGKDTACLMEAARKYQNGAGAPKSPSCAANAIRFIEDRKRATAKLF
jgi:hypothetical protein